jgi:hypothetical protein
VGVGRLGFARSGLLFSQEKDTKEKRSTSNILPECLIGETPVQAKASAAKILKEDSNPRLIESDGGCNNPTTIAELQKMTPAIN